MPGVCSVNRRWLVILPLLMAITGCGGTKFYVQGVDLEWLKDAEPKDAAVMALGAAAAFAAHELAHELTKDGTKGEGHAGFAAQSALGLILTSFEGTRNSYFTRGVVGMNNVQIWSYPLRRDRDIDLMGNDGMAWWGLYSTVAVHNTLRVQW